MAEGDGGDGRGSGGAPPVFISYASQDSALAEPACRALEDAGVACWIAPRDATAGTFYAAAIVHAIDAATITVLILSQNSTASQHVMKLPE